MTSRTCTLDDCTKPHYGRGWCKFHYQRAYLNGRLEDQPRTLSKCTDSLDARLRNIGWTVTDAGCWEWKGAQDGHGYGQLSVNRGRPWKAYRIAYEAWVKVPAQNVDICHSCDNPICINPGHLFEGARAVNVADMVSKQRVANGERRPHKLTDAQVATIRRVYAEGGRTQRSLAREFGVSSSLISGITCGRRRLHETFHVRH